MLEEAILGTAVGMLILIFFFINYWFSTKEHKTERNAQVHKSVIPCRARDGVIRMGVTKLENLEKMRRE